MIIEHLTTFGRLMQDLEAAIDALFETLPNHALVQANLFALPRRSQSQTHDPYGPIKAYPLTGLQALERAKTDVREWYAEGEASTKAVLRLPGVLVFDCDPLVVRTALDTVNHLKRTLHETARLIYPDDAKLRHRTLRQAHPRLVLLQLTRQLHLFENLFSVRFTWVRKNALVKLDKLKADQLLEKTKQLQTLSPSSDIPWDQRVDLERAHLRTLPSHVKLRYRRPVKPHPMANVSFNEWKVSLKGEPRRVVKMIDANLPFIVISSKPLRVGWKDYSPVPTTRRRRSRLTADQPITPLAPLYILTDAPGPDSESGLPE